MKPKLSISFIARNEAKTITRALHSIREFMGRGGDVNVLDTGSTDGTQELARALGCRVREVGTKYLHTIDDEMAARINGQFIVKNEYPLVHPGEKYFDFASARNESAEMADCDTILVMDCDEVITRFDIDRIDQLIEEGYTQFEYQFVFQHLPDGTDHIKYPQKRMYNRRNVRWEGIIHEGLVGTSRMKFLDDSVFKHEHFQNVETNRTGYLRGLAVDCFLNPHKDRNCHYFAREMWWNGRPWSAAKEFKRHMAMDVSSFDKMESMLFLCDIHGAMEQPDEQLFWAHMAFGLDTTRREPILKLAQVYMRRAQWSSSHFYATMALGFKWDESYGCTEPYFRNEPHEILHICNGWLGNMSGAREYLMKCLDYQPDNPQYLDACKFYFPKVSICIPSMGREKMLERLLSTIGKNAGFGNYEIVVERGELPPNNTGVTKALAKCVERSTGELVMFLANDVIPGPNFLREAMRKMTDTFPDFDGLIGLNDQHYKEGQVATHWLASKKLLPMLDGEFFHTGYFHAGCDNELTGRCIMAGKYAWAEKAIIVHDHPINGASSDELYAQAYSGPRAAADEILYPKRAAMLGIGNHMWDEVRRMDGEDASAYADRWVKTIKK